MMKHKKVILCIVSLCISMFAGMGVSVGVQAEEYEGKPVTAVDEQGNVYEVQPEIGIVEEGVTPFSNGNERIVNFNTKGNAVTEYVADTGVAGYTNGAYGADAAYLGETGGNVKFLLSGVIGEVSKGQVQVIDKSAAKSVSYYTVSGGRLIHKVTTNINSEGHASTIRVGRAPSFLAEGGQYYSYDGHYFYAQDRFAAMLEDYRNNTRSSALNPQTPYYNYFQFLPMRSGTSYSAETLDSMIAGQTRDGSKMLGTGTALVNSQNSYGINALLATGVAANESGWGLSNLAITKNNLFGINAVDSNPNDAFAYADVSTCIKDFTETYMSKGYLDPTDWRYFGGVLGNKAGGINVKYASDPYWGEKAAQIAYILDEAGGNRDQGMYTIGIKDTLAGSHQNLSVRAEARADAATMYRTGTQSDTAFLIQDATPQNGFLKIMSDGVLNADRTGIAGDSGNYDFNSMYGFIEKDKITVVNEGKNAGIDRFLDVDEKEWYYEYVKFVYDKGLMTGLNMFNFGTSGELSRAHFTTTLHRMSGGPAVSYDTIFPDVSDGMFYTQPVLWAHANNVVKGYENGYYGPSDMITREHMALLMYRYAQFRGLDIKDKGDLGLYPDAGSVSFATKEAMEWAVGAKLIQGDQGRLSPQGNASRAQTATIITRFMRKYGL